MEAEYRLRTPRGPANWTSWLPVTIPDGPFVVHRFVRGHMAADAVEFRRGEISRLWEFGSLFSAFDGEFNIHMESPHVATYLLDLRQLVF